MPGLRAVKGRLALLAVVLALVHAGLAAAAARPAPRAEAPAPAAVEAPPAGPVADYRPVPAEERSLGWDVLRALVALGAVLGLFGLSVKALKRWPGAGGARLAPGELEVLGRLPLTAKESVCLVRAGGDVLVLGVAGSGITLLHRLAAGTAVRPAAPPAAPMPAGGRPAGTALRELAARIREVHLAWGAGFPGAERRR
ncbi:MAG: FliO/MopB family protein [Candidatus Methylomirabilales bacterium]